jgi:4-diphosphocytidyl-2-C-methyl-D-erythritol kinase
MLLKSHAKINLYLHITQKIKDLHGLDSLFCYIDLYDKIEIFPAAENVIKANYQINMLDNIIFKTIKNFQGYYKVNGNFSILHHKEIPLGSGMGGGSANAAVILRYLYEFYKIKENLTNKIKFAEFIGSDVPFFMQNHARYISGIGEIIGNKCNIYELPIILIYPNEILSTKQVFTSLTKESFSQDNINKPINFSKKYDFIAYLKDNKNDLYEIAADITPAIRDIHNYLAKEKNVIVRLTGSGSTSFVICKDKDKQDDIYKKLQLRYPNFFIRKSKLLNKI